MSESLERLEAWRRAVDRPYEDCYWPGPKTMDHPSRAEQLVGRDEDADEVARLVQDTNVVVLSGNSGVGKSSMLGMKIYPRLEALGFKVGFLRKFPTVSFPPGARPEVGQISDAIRDALSRAVVVNAASSALEIDQSTSRREVMVSEVALTAIPGDADLILWLEQHYPKRSLIILDQFEEVIRQQPELFDAVHDWIDWVVAHSGVRILISLRSEHAYRLGGLVVGAYQRADAEIEPLQGEAVIKEVIRRGRRVEDVFAESSAGEPPAYKPYSVPIDGVDSVQWSRVVSEDPADDAVDALYRQWELAGGNSRTTQISLLHLQAVLFVLWKQNGDSAPIGRDAVLKLIGDATRSWSGDRGEGAPTPRQSAQRLFDWALAQVLDSHFDACAGALALLHAGEFVDLPLLYGTRAVLAQIAPLLSSGGYKIEQDLGDLAQTAVSWRDSVGMAGDGELREWTRHRPDEAVLADWLVTPFTYRGEGVRDDYSAGVLSGASSEVVKFHSARCFQFALEWLRSGQLARFSSTSTGGEAVELAHDGFGTALRRWGDHNARSPEIDVYDVRRVIGERLGFPAWRDVTRDAGRANFFNGADEAGGFKLIANVAWTSCQVVDTRFERVIFMNCDFSDSKFSGCTFRGVTFINCILDGVAFDRCTISGPVARASGLTVQQRAERKKITGAPAFATLGHDELGAAVAEFVVLQNHYAKVPVVVRGAWLYSETSGVPALAVDEGDAREDAVLDWIAQPTGLAFCGGRLSSLAFAACEGDDGGAVMLREVVGTSLDFAEQPSLSIEVLDAAVRGVTVSPNVLVHEDWAEDVEQPSIRFYAERSRLENVWFSDGLLGSAQFTSCAVLQLMSVSPRTDPENELPGFDVQLDDSLFWGAVNVSNSWNFAEGTPDRPIRVTTESTLPLVRPYAKNIDYRSDAVRDRLKARESD